MSSPADSCRRRAILARVLAPGGATYLFVTAKVRDAIRKGSDPCPDGAQGRNRREDDQAREAFHELCALRILSHAAEQIVLSSQKENARYERSRPKYSKKNGQGQVNRSAVGVTRVEHDRHCCRSWKRKAEMNRESALQIRIILKVTEHGGIHEPGNDFQTNQRRCS